MLSCRHILLVLTLITTNIFPVNAYEGTNSLEACRAVANETFTSNAHYMGYCIGVAESMMSPIPPGVKCQLDYCIPKAVTTQQGIRVLVNYMDKHPEKTHLELRVIAVLAFMEAWLRPRH